MSATIPLQNYSSSIEKMKDMYEKVTETIGLVLLPQNS